jgi:hypothetical protein
LQFQLSTNTSGLASQRLHFGIKGLTFDIHSVTCQKIAASENNLIKAGVVPSFNCMIFI